MVRLDINEFIEECDDSAAVSLPYLAKKADVISSRFRVNGTMADRKYAYLLVSGVVGEAEIFFGEASVGTVTLGERRVFDVKKFMSVGDTQISIRLSEGGALVEPPVLLSFNNAAIDSVHIAERHEGGAAILDVKLRTLGSTDGIKAIATLVSPTGQIYYGGITGGYGTITVKDPLYWWPRGLGVQNLYRLTVNLYGHSDIEDTQDIIVGLRSTAVAREGGVGLSFNDTPFVPMGALYTLPDADAPVGTLENELRFLAQGGANSVFLDSSVEYIPSEFARLCDREGLVIFRETGDPTRINAELDRLSTHPSLAFVLIPEGEGQDGAYTAVRAVAPDAAIILGRESEDSIIATMTSLPEEKTLFGLGDKREINPLSAKLLSRGGEAYWNMLLSVADEYLFPSGPMQLGYLTRLLQAKDAERKIKEARLTFGNNSLSFAIYSELCDRFNAPSGSAIDFYGRKKLLYYRASHAMSAVVAMASRTEAGADITVVNYRRTELSGRLFYRILDSKNNLVYNYTEEISVSALGSAVFTGKFDEYLSERVCECYLEYGIISYDAQYSDTMLFVKPKDFLFEKPDIKVKVEGVGEDFSITLSSDRYTAGVEIITPGVDLELSGGGFDITSPAPIKLFAKLNSGKISAEEIESRIKINCLNTIGIDN